MNHLDKIRARARKSLRKIVLPEGDEPRVVEAAIRVKKEGIADPILLGASGGSGLEMVDPRTSPHIDKMAAKFYELRKSKGISEEQAKDTLLRDRVYYAALMVRLGMADGFVAGAAHTTSNVARAAIHCMEIDRTARVVSSSFLIMLDDKSFGEDGLLVFADCGIVPDPSAKQMAGIAISSAGLLRSLLGVEPRVAMLSYSTKGSAKGDLVDKVREATELAKKKEKGLIIDGEMQVDSALIPDVAKIKCPKSPVGGKANVLIFPNLDSGNIAYKLIQRIAGARVVGPLLQGLKQPCSDLSRGCGVDEIVDAITATAARAQTAKGSA
ncbi:MAG: phosphate acetyltransferase [Candidatus Omnitrophica bacterium]|nr:phosphate acetyltransferase [Candidatus Omnitrophota bacterium]